MGTICKSTKGAIAWTAEEDAVVLELVPKGKPLSAAVRIGRDSEAVIRRYAELQSGRRIRKDRLTSRARNATYKMTEAHKERIRQGVSHSRKQRGSTV